MLKYSANTLLILPSLSSHPHQAPRQTHLQHPSPSRSSANIAWVLFKQLTQVWLVDISKPPHHGLSDTGKQVLGKNLQGKNRKADHFMGTALTFIWWEVGRIK